MERETDVNNIIAAIEGRLVYNSVIGQVPWIHPYLFGNTFVAWLASFVPAVAILNSSRYIVQFTQKRINDYHAQKFNTLQLSDLLSRFKRVKDGKQVMNESDLLNGKSSSLKDHCCDD